jgi:mRNA-degrading endonuclease toxin of MazEF toxin-antitoxin module
MIGPGSAVSRTPVRRGEIWWVNFDPTEGSEIRKARPAIVVKPMLSTVRGERSWSYRSPQARSPVRRLSSPRPLPE